MDSSAACLMQLAKAVHQQGYKVALTGEGADEALAGYPWFKTQQIRQRLIKRFGNGDSLGDPQRGRRLAARRPGPPAASVRHAGLPDRPAGRLRPDGPGAVAHLLGRHVERTWAAYSVYEDLGIDHDRFTRWAPLNQSLYVGYKVMLAGLLLHGKGDRVAMNSSVEGAVSAARRGRGRLLRVDRPRVQAEGADRQVDLAAGRRADAPQEDRQPSQDDVPRQPLRGVLRRTAGPRGSTSFSAANRWKRPATSTPRGSSANARRSRASPGSRPAGSSWT